jgi:Major Facilitator Superfamily
VAVNAAIAPWYERGRPMALAKAYNGASIGGVVFSPLWVWLIGQWGFTVAATVIGAAMVAVIVAIARGVYTRTPGQLGQHADNEPPAAATSTTASPKAQVLKGRLLWRDRAFVSLALGMAAGLFAQIGLLAHLFSLLVPALGAQAAGLAMGFATACAIGGRLVVARALPSGANRRSIAALAYGVQMVGTLALLLASDHQAAWILLGVALFGSGIGNATSLPPLIAKEDVPRVVALIVAFAQATYAFAPAIFALVLTATAGASTLFVLAVAAVQGIAILCFLAGRRRT